MNLKQASPNIESPYAQCDQCYYVSKKLKLQRICPVCQTNHQQGYTIWPDPELEELLTDEVAMYNQQRVELSAVVATMYFESSVFHLIFWGALWLDPKLNWIGLDSDEIPKKQKEIWAFLNSIRTHKNTDAALKRIFGLSGREMLIKVLGQDKANFFYQEYGNLADYRNKTVHQGRRSVIRRNNTPTISDPKANQILDWCLKFVYLCRDVFAKLHNEFIHKPMWERKQKG